MMFPFKWNLSGGNFAWYTLLFYFSWFSENVSFLWICSLANLMNQFILKLPMTPATPGIWLFCKNFGEIPWYFGSLDSQMHMPHQLVLLKVSNPSSPTIQKFFHASNCLFKCKYSTKHNQNTKNPFACDTDQCVGVKVKCLTWGAGEHILGQIPHCMEQNSSQMPGVCTGAGRGG